MNFKENSSEGEKKKCRLWLDVRETWLCSRPDSSESEKKTLNIIGFFFFLPWRRAVGRKQLNEKHTQLQGFSQSADHKLSPTWPGEAATLWSGSRGLLLFNTTTPLIIPPYVQSGPWRRYFLSLSCNTQSNIDTVSFKLFPQRPPDTPEIFLVMDILYT